MAEKKLQTLQTTQFLFEKWGVLKTPTELKCESDLQSIYRVKKEWENKAEFQMLSKKGAVSTQIPSKENNEEVICI